MSAPRTIEEVKNDIRDRVGHRAPFLHADKDESEQALARMPDFEGETWAAAWNALGAKWQDQAMAAEKAGNAAAAKVGLFKILRLLRHRAPSLSEHAREASRLFENPRDVSRRIEIFRYPGGKSGDPLPGQSHRRPSASAETTAGADDHALGRHRQLERRAPLLRREFRQARLGLFHHR